VIIMDIRMPDLDGLTAIRELRAQPDLARVPIIALTALAMPGDRERCLAAGATAYVSKPINLRELVRIIDAHTT
jgi:CheY-like chemotaxis protein